MNKKRIVSATLASALLFAPFLGQTSSVLADSFYANQTNAERADITNWVANDTEQISSNISSQHIDVNNLDQSNYIIQWGDTLSGISAATGISVRKLAYDNNIKNVDLIYAGDTLILNRDGYVPANWDYQGDGTWVANTKVTINNFTDNSDNSVNINVSPVTVNDKSTNNSTNIYASPADPEPTTATADGDATAVTSSSVESSSTESKAASSKQADADSDTGTASSTDTSRATTAPLDDDEFADAITAKLADKLGLEDESELTVDFTEQDADATTDSESSATEDEDTESVADESSDADAASEDSETEALYTEDQPIVTRNTKQTTKNANKLAKKIYRQLKVDDKLSEIKDATDIEVIVIATDDGFDFNVALPTDTDTDSSDATTDTDSSSDDADSATDDTESAEDSTSENENEASDTTFTTNSDQAANTDVAE
ncbi:LysM peptidoglycan-binding domain-containing protein [Loigolactobacillus binensis]|uniref:LysM peptidoglycan-binding domain-containing protein n=1 Tax=Loigolactobacillus binensis TaxID=2559922 RepID=A0ABW3EFM1_9LACO|nr:LysM peptidoglycan-binding domain-containing protein [Loigolactobacillus binensis]